MSDEHNNRVPSKLTPLGESKALVEVNNKAKHHKTT